MADWDFYQANINDKIASVYLNLDAESELRAELTHLYWFFIKLKVEREDGLSHEDEADSLWDFEDRLVSSICSEELEFVGRVTTAGMRQFYFYGTENVNYDELCQNFLKDNDSYLHQYNSQEDVERSHYKNVLYPGEKGLEQINKRRENA